MTSEPISVRARFERFPATVKGAFIIRGEDPDPHQVVFREARVVAIGGAHTHPIAMAVAEKLSALVTTDYLAQRALRGDASAFERILARVPDVPAEPWDERPGKAAHDPDGRSKGENPSE